MLGALAKRLLGACTVLVLGPREASDPQVRDLQRRIDAVEDAIDHERAERKILTADVEASLDQATTRYSNARAAEVRAGKKGGPGGNGGVPLTPDELLAQNPEAFDKWVAAGRPPLGG